MARSARPRPGSSRRTARTSGSSRASRSAMAQVASVLPLSAIVTRAVKGKLSRRKPTSRRTLGARSRSSLRTGTTMSTWRTFMAARMGDHVPWRLKPGYVRAMSKALAEPAGHRAELAEVRVDHVALADEDRAGERPGQDHLPGRQELAVGAELVGQPGDAVGGMAEYPGRHA